jgi:hypothetical protein
MMKGNEIIKRKTILKIIQKITTKKNNNQI